jgi:hypothetical protein
VAQAENQSTEVKMKKEKEKMTSQRTKLVLSEEQKTPIGSWPFIPDLSYKPHAKGDKPKVKTTVNYESRATRLCIVPQLTPHPVPNLAFRMEAHAPSESNAQQTPPRCTLATQPSP